MAVHPRRRRPMGRNQKDPLMATIQDLSTEAGRILDNYNQTVDRIRNNRTLSAEGKRDQLAAAWIRTLDLIAAVRSRYSDDNTAELTKLEDELTKPRRSFSDTPADRVAIDTSYRDALQRAHATTLGTKELVDLWQLARSAGDDLLAKAAVVVAVNRPDISLVRAVEGVDATLGAKVMRLLNLRSGANNLRNQMGLWMQIPDPNKPPEVMSIGSEPDIRAHVGYQP